jgi:hypothetical protein
MAGETLLGNACVMTIATCYCFGARSAFCSDGNAAAGASDEHSIVDDNLRHSSSVDVLTIMSAIKWRRLI